MPQDETDDWEDLLGTGTVMKQVVVHGSRASVDELDGINLEAPRKFFASIDIETRLEDRLLETESHKDFLINNEADIFPGAHLVIPLMELNETSRYRFDPKFVYGQTGNPPEVPPNAILECTITLKSRAPYDEFLERLTFTERYNLAKRKRDRGIFWYHREDYDSSISVFQSIIDLCQDLGEENENHERGVNSEQEVPMVRG
uniref:peptidylprolyl isomerase n=1 Tax=Aceria tosichella TaxID=561515 RepID=A0A6G1SMI0_9ACAR